MSGGFLLAALLATQAGPTVEDMGWLVGTWRSCQPRYEEQMIWRRRGGELIGEWSRIGERPGPYAAVRIAPSRREASGGISLYWEVRGQGEQEYPFFGFNLGDQQQITFRHPTSFPRIIAFLHAGEDEERLVMALEVNVPEDPLNGIRIGFLKMGPSGACPPDAQHRIRYGRPARQ